MTDDNCTYYHGEPFIMYITVRSLGCTPESNIALPCTSVKKRIFNDIGKSRYKMQTEVKRTKLGHTAVSMIRSQHTTSAAFNRKYSK